MNRHGGSAAIKDAVKRLREAVPDIAIRTTAIVGFPSESEEEFEALCEYVKETRFTNFGAFTYSQEEQTPAAEMDCQIDEQKKEDRYSIIMQIQERIVEEENEKLLGTTVKVLLEGYDEVAEAYYGRSEKNAPEIDGKIYFEGPKRMIQGSFVNIKITEVVDYDLFGVIVKE